MEKGTVMGLCQRITGIILCVLLIVSLFLPLYEMTSDKVLKAVESSLEDAMERGKLEKNTGVEINEDYLREYISKLKKEYSVLIDSESVSCFNIAITPAKSITDNFEPYTENIESEYLLMYKTLQENIIDGFAGYYKILRIFVWIYILLILLVLVGILTEWLTRRGKWIYIISVWLMGIINIIYFISVQFIIPGKLSGKLTDSIESLLNGLVGTTSEFSALLPEVERLLTVYIKKILWLLNGSGYYCGVIVVALCIIWSIWCIVCTGKKSAQATGDIIPGYIPDVPGQVNLLPDNIVPYNVNQVNAAGGNAIPDAGIMGKGGIIRCVTGTYGGADIPLDSGGKVIVGRDSLVCQLVLPEPDVSRKHFSVEYNQITSMYRIECFSANGLKLSGNKVVAQSKVMEVPHGTQIFMAKGKEILLLV